MVPIWKFIGVFIQGSQGSIECFLVFDIFIPHNVEYSLGLVPSLPFTLVDFSAEFCFFIEYIVWVMMPSLFSLPEIFYYRWYSPYRNIHAASSFYFPFIV